MCAVWSVRALLLLAALRAAVVVAGAERDHRTRARTHFDKFQPEDEAQLDAEYWVEEAQDAIRDRVGAIENSHAARNVIMFLGDGMSVTTLAAARTLLGQRQGRTGEEERLAFETFPVTGMAKTYCVDAQVADSACTSTAYLCGVKGNRGTIGVTGRVPRAHCTAATRREDQATCVGAWALAAGRDAGLVTSTRVTNASPAGMYAHVAERDWEDDAEVRADGCDPELQRDVAYQLVHHYPGHEFKVILGGGRREFIPVTSLDEQGSPGKRLDGRDLIADWVQDKLERNITHSYVWNRTALLQEAGGDGHLLGLFTSDHLKYHMQTDEREDPTLAELTEVAIRRLSKNDKGYFLFVEGGRIDHAHHDNLVHMALDETIEFSKAVERARNLTSDRDTLILVTSDHSHVMSYSGYSQRGRDVLGPTDDVGDDLVPYMTLSYANGPGFRPHVATGVRQDVTQYDYRDMLFPFPAEVPRYEETHGGEDVAVFALGPQQHMFTGLYEQSQLPHLMAYAACLGRGRHAPACSTDHN